MSSCHDPREINSIPRASIRDSTGTYRFKSSGVGPGRLTMQRLHPRIHVARCFAVLQHLGIRHLQRGHEGGNLPENDRFESKDESGQRVPFGQGTALQPTHLVNGPTEGNSLLGEKAGSAGNCKLDYLRVGLEPRTPSP